MLGQLGLGLDKPERKRPAVVKLEDNMTVTMAVAGGMHTVLVGGNGKVQTFGCNDEYALGRTCVEKEDLPKDEAEGVPGYAEGLEGVDVASASAGDSHSFVLTKDGRVFGAGCFRDPSGSFAFSATSALAKEFVQVYPPIGEEPVKNIHILVLFFPSTRPSPPASKALYPLCMAPYRYKYADTHSTVDVNPFQA